MLLTWSGHSSFLGVDKLFSLLGNPYLVGIHHLTKLGDASGEPRCSSQQGELGCPFCPN
jgi:hypothetical protein